MTTKEIIDGLKFTVDMFLFNPSTGETYEVPMNEMDQITVNACRGAIELLEKMRWIPVSKGLPEYGEAVLTYHEDDEEYQINWVTDDETGEWFHENPTAWMSLPEPYKAESEE